MTKTRGWILDHLVPTKVSTRLRASRSGGRSIAHLVPEGRTAIDAGANIGLYTYWLARRASVVYAFEPQPGLHAQLVAGAARNVRAEQLALSDARGTATLHVPVGGEGEASLRTLDSPTQDVAVDLAVIDEMGINDVGFMKIDVEGHEEEVLRGARRVIERDHPTLFVEIEERHNPGGVGRIADWLAALGYEDAHFERAGEWHLVKDFDATVHQAGRPGSELYALDFLFRHGQERPVPPRPSLS